MGQTKIMPTPKTAYLREVIESIFNTAKMVDESHNTQAEAFPYLQRVPQLLGLAEDMKVISKEHYTMLYHIEWNLGCGDQRLVLYVGIIVGLLYKGRTFSDERIMRRREAIFPGNSDMKMRACNEYDFAAMVIGFWTGVWAGFTPEGRIHMEGGARLKQLLEAYSESHAT